MSPCSQCIKQLEIESRISEVHLFPFFQMSMKGPRSLTLQGRVSVPPNSDRKVDASDSITGCGSSAADDEEEGVGTKLYGWPERQKAEKCFHSSVCSMLDFTWHI